MLRRWIGPLAALALVLAGAMPAVAQSVGFLFEFGSRGSAPGQFSFPEGVAVDGSDNIVVADTLNFRIQICDVSDRQNVTCGTFGSFGGAPGQFNWPRGVAVDGSGSIVVADGGTYFFITGGTIRRGNFRIQICDVSDLQNVACGTVGSPGSAPGQFDRPQGVAVDGSGNIVVADGGSVVLRPGGAIRVGNDRVQICDVSALPTVDCETFGDRGSAPGQLEIPNDVAVDGAGNIVVADARNNRIQICDVSALPTVSCETFGSFGSAPGQFASPAGVAVDASGHIVVADNGNHRIQICDVSALPTVDCETFGSRGSAPGQFAFPRGVAVDGSGNIVVADTNNNRIQVLSGPDSDGDAIADEVDACPMSTTTTDQATVAVNNVMTTVMNDPAATTPVPGAPLSGERCFLQDIIDQAVASASPCVPVTLARAVTLAVRSLQLGGDLTPQEALEIRIAATRATCP